VVAGLDEGVTTMQPGGIRRLYIPGSLSFPNGLKAGPGRPSVPPNSPVVFDVQLLYIPGLEDEDE
jgi:peptidylprolyl isomerase